MPKISAWFIFLALAIGIAAAYIYLNYIRIPDELITVRKTKDKDIITMTLPSSGNWGPSWWKAKEFLNANLPCSLCSTKAVPLGSFEHDVVNGMQEKPNFPFDKENWKFWVKKINELDNKVV